MNEGGVCTCLVHLILLSIEGGVLYVFGALDCAIDCPVHLAVLSIEGGVLCMLGSLD